MAGTVSHSLRQASEAIAAVSDTPRLDAELLMAEALGVSRSDLLLRHMGDAVPERFASLVGRRLEHEPVAYIVGRQGFYGLDFLVTPGVLIPRGDSETLVAAALAGAPGAQRVLDCGTGSGALLLAVLSELKSANGIGIDRSDRALAVARENALRLGLESRATMILGDWSTSEWTRGLGSFDLILANPPYVENDAVLAPGMRDHEPHSALFAGPEGLDDYHRLIPQLACLLNPLGIAVIEIGASQANLVTAIAQAAGFAVRLHRDLADRPRALELSRTVSRVQ